MSEDKKLTWRDVMDCKRQFGWRQDFAFAVVQVGYKYFVWNDRVYKCNDYSGEDVVDTDLTVKDLT